MSDELVNIEAEAENNDEELSAFGRLSRQKQRFVLIYVDNQRDKTLAEIASMLGISHDTVENTLKDSDVKEAILDLVRANFRFKGEISLLNKIQQIEDDNKDNANDRKLKSEILGLVNGNTISLHLNNFGGASDKRIKRRNLKIS
jgi:hypothetical protein